VSNGAKDISENHDAIMNNRDLYSINDHIKIHIAQSAKGARVEVTIDREDHDIDKAVEQGIEAYEKSLQGLIKKNLKVDEH